MGMNSEKESRRSICYILICIYMQNNSERHNDKGRAKTSLTKICTSHFILRVRKGYSRFYCERELETEQNCNILTPTLMAINVVSFSFSRVAQLEAQGPSSLLAFSTTSYQQLLWTPTHQGLQGPLRPGLAFPTTSHLYNSNCNSSRPQGPLRPGVAFPTTSYQQLISNCLTSVLTELYNSSTPTQLPTRSLEWHVLSSSSGNNCHAVQRSLSSGVSVYECIMRFFTLSHFIS